MRAALGGLGRAWEKKVAGDWTPGRFERGTGEARKTCFRRKKKLPDLIFPIGGPIGHLKNRGIMTSGVVMIDVGSDLMSSFGSFGANSSKHSKNYYAQNMGLLGIKIHQIG